MAQLERLGKYRLLQLIGAGASAQVYQARDELLERDVAVKVLLPHFLSEQSFVERFYKEARTMASLAHPNIATVHDMGVENGRLFIVMELASASFEQLIRQHNALAWPAALDLLRPICLALDFAHGRGIVHRDLKPANLLISAHGEPLIADFGFAQVLGEHSASISIGSSKITGTAAYIAPEIWDGRPPSPASDLYALACIFVELLTGIAMFGGQTPLQVMRAHATGPHLPASWPAGVPAGVERVIRRALSADPSARHASATLFWQELAALGGLARVERAEPAPPAVVPQGASAPVATAAPRTQGEAPRPQSAARGPEQAAEAPPATAQWATSSLVGDRGQPDAASQRAPRQSSGRPPQREGAGQMGREADAPVRGQGDRALPTGLWRAVAVLSLCWMTAGALWSFLDASGLTFGQALAMQGAILGLGFGLGLAQAVPRYGLPHTLATVALGAVLFAPQMDIFERLHELGAPEWTSVAVSTTLAALCAALWALVLRWRLPGMPLRGVTVIMLSFGLARLVGLLAAQAMYNNLYDLSPLWVEIFAYFLASIVAGGGLALAVNQDGALAAQQELAS